MRKTLRVAGNVRTEYSDLLINRKSLEYSVAKSTDSTLLHTRLHCNMINIATGNTPDIYHNHTVCLAHSNKNTTHSPKSFQKTVENKQIHSGGPH